MYADAYRRRGCHRRHCRRAIPGELAKLSKQCSAESKPARAGGEGKGQWKRMRIRESSFFFGSFNFLAHSAVGSLAAGFVFCASSSVHVVFVAVRASCRWFPLVPACYSVTAHNHRLTDFASHHHPASEARRSSQLQHKFRPFAFMMTYVHPFLTSLCIANVPPQRSRWGECFSPGCIPVFGSPLPGNKSLHCVVFAVCRAATLEYVAGCASFTQTLLLWPGNAGDSFSSFCRSLVLKCNVTPPSFQPCETVCVTARRTQDQPA